MKKIILLLVLSYVAVVAQPTQTSPTNHAYTQEILTVLNWTATTGPYTLEVYKDAAMTSVVLSQAGIVANTFTLVTPLDYNTKYYWRVQDATAAWSASLWDFTTKLNAKPTLTNPLNTSTVYTTSATLNWYSSLVTASYDIQIRPAVPPADNVVDYSVGSTVSYKVVNSLTSGQTYYWRVRANQLSNSSDWSDIWSFTVSTSTGPVKPVATFPLGGATVYTDQPYLNWYVLSSATDLQFDVQLKIGAGAYSTVASNLTTNYFQLPSLTASTTYYWQVRSHNGAGTSSWSDEVSFVTSSSIPGNPIKPIIAFPAGDIVVYGTSAYFYWYLDAASTGMSFEYELKPLATPFTNTPDVTGITDLFYEVTGLTAGTNYHWQVRSRLGVQTSAWSDPATFSTIAAAAATPVTPIPSYPTGGAIVYTMNPYLYWYTDSYVPGTEYQLQYNTVNTFTDIAPVPVVVSGINHQLTNLVAGQTYYWRVRQRLIATPATTSAWCAAQSFVVGSTLYEGPQKPVLVFPTGNTVVYKLKPILSWYIPGSPSLIQYELQYKLDSDDWSLATSPALMAANSYEIPTNLTGGAIYRWRVRSVYNGTQNSPWSDEGVFIVDATSTRVAGTPITGSPVNGIQVNEKAVNLSWFVPQKSTNTKYALVVSENANLSSPVVQAENVTGTSYKANLNSNKKYYWAVKAVSQTGFESNYSSKGVFKTGNTTAVENETLPVEYSLDQNYPNPFNPSTVINYSLPNNSLVTLRVYDLLGREVKTLINNEVAAGKHSVNWMGDDNIGNKVATGVYVYRISAGNFVSSKKMMLVK